jgi:hypothetical protein
MIMAAALRKFTLAVHLTVSVGWIGAAAGYIALDVPPPPAGTPVRCGSPTWGWTASPATSSSR